MKQNSIVQLLGVYHVRQSPNVHLIELLIKKPPNEVDISTFTQKNELLPESCWQAAYDEHYLSEDGTSVIGTFCDQNNVRGTETRIAFFMHFVDFNKPLLSEFGELALSSPSPMPERLLKVITFEPVD